MTQHPDTPPTGPTFQTNVHGDVSTSGGLFNTGTLNQYTYLAAGASTLAPVPLDVALARLAALPTDHVPPIAPLPPGSWLPMPANPYFVGRQAELLALAAALKGGATVGITPGSTIAATGLGGIGKTQLAAAFAHHYGHYFLGGVYWLSFADPAAISSEIAQCAAWMSDLATGVTHLPIPDQVQIVRHAWHEPLPRLLIFDNCEDPALLEEWRPKSGGCRILLTSRRARWSGSQGVTTITLGTLPREESIALLRKFAPSPNLGEGWGEGILDAIATELGDLPLALHMAGSYLATVAYDLTPAAYLAALRRPGLLDHLSLTSADYSPTGHELHVARTFALSYARLDDTNLVDATARHLLACAACFASGEAIPRALLRTTAGVGGDEHAEDAATALTRLVNLGLLEELTGGTLRLHRLLQHFVANTLAVILPTARSSVESTVLAAASRLNQTGDPRPLLEWQPHLRHSTIHTQTRVDETAASLCNELGFHLNMIGNYTEALQYNKRAFDIFKVVLGDYHSVTATTLNNLGHVLQALGDYRSARSYYEQALAIHEQVQGKLHPSTATILSNLGDLLQVMGDYENARAQYEQALAIYLNMLGEHHSATATTLNNLGSLLQAIGDYKGAWEYYQRVLDIRQQLFGKKHPSIATIFNNLGTLSRATRDYTSARNYYEWALEIRQQVLGEYHPDTATTLNNLGTLLYDTGDYKDARFYFERVLAIRQHLLGEYHPDTAQSINNLGALLRVAGDYMGACKYYEQALVIRQQILGEHHPATATILNNLGILAYYGGDKVAAQIYLEQALAICELNLAPNHPDTERTRNSLAIVCAELPPIPSALSSQN